MKKIRLLGMHYSPGYCDMSGGSHGTSLQKQENGEWVISSTNSEDHNSPTVTMTFSVLPEALAELENFINTKKILSLSKRPKSDMFITDYSPWSYSFDYETKSFGKVKRSYCSFGQYLNYSKRDLKLLDELSKRFSALYGEKLSETVEEDR